MCLLYQAWLENLPSCNFFFNYFFSPPLCSSLLGADQASATAQTNLHIAQAHVKQARQRSREAEEELKVSKAEVSQRLQSTSPAVAENEEEIPEAYLRED